MSIAAVVTLLQQAINDLSTASVPQGTRVPAGASVQSFHDSAAPGDTLVLNADTVYSGALTVTKDDLTITTTQELPTRGKVIPTAMIMGVAGADAVTVLAKNFKARGIGIGHVDSARQLVAWSGHRLALAQCLALGSVNGQHRGLAVNGVGGFFQDTVVDECWLPGRDAQAVMGWDGTRDLWFDNCDLLGGGQSVMFGGADSTRPDRIPTNISLTNTNLTKKAAWYARGAQIKTALELKAVCGFTMSGGTAEYAGTSDGQGAYLFVFTIRNQDGGAPWSVVRDVLVENVHGRYASGGINILGADDTVGKPSDAMQNVCFRNVAMTDLDPFGITRMAAVNGGSGRGVMISGNNRTDSGKQAADRITLDGLTFDGQNMGATLYLNANPLPTRFTMRNVKTMASAYGYKLDGANSGLGGANGLTAIAARMPDAVFAITAFDAGATV